jgi:hypothetical protein
MSIDREKHLARQRRYNQSERGRARHARYNGSKKGAERRWRYEDSERGQEMRWTYQNWIGWLRRRYQGLDVAVGRLEEEGEALYSEWATDPILASFFDNPRKQMEEQRAKAPKRQRQREESLERGMYYLRRERMRRGLIPSEDLGPEPASAILPSKPFLQVVPEKAGLTNSA